MVVTSSCSFTGSSTSTRVDARERFTERALQLIHELTLWAHQPSGLIPDSPPIHVLVVEVILIASRGLLTLYT